MKRLGVANAFPIGITLNNCTSFLSAISIAVNMVRSGGARNILIVTADKVYDETIRFNNFALLSDAAASCIVTARPVAGYHLAASSFRAADDPIETNHGRDDSALYQRVFEEVMSQANLTSEQVAQVFCSNIFRSITLIKERKLGFAKKQLFLSNVSKYGHCFSAGEHYVISADAPNLRASIVLRRAEALACA
jgi:3-oxoacyl-[acyl-carrier-protein] synthase-3